MDNTVNADFRALYNGNIDAISQNQDALGKPLLYNYVYDQLNRLIRVRAYKNSSGNFQVTNTWNPAMINDFSEDVSYDANGNILKYKRYANSTNQQQSNAAIMDSLNYYYEPNSNRLDRITDSIGNAKFTVDIDNQANDNYGYDSIGNLVRDNAEKIDSILWTVYGKIGKIYKQNGTIISYSYDAGGNRLSKVVTGAAGGNGETWYVHDASGNTMAVYTVNDNSVNSGALTLSEQNIYGSSRLGIYKPLLNLAAGADSKVYLPGVDSGYYANFIRGQKFFELTNHLGNVLTTITDKKLGVYNGSGVLNYFSADIVNASDYYPGGMQMPGRSYTASSANYRYGFNGKENDNEVKGVGNWQDYGNRMYDPRIGRFPSVDPITSSYPELTPYQFASNNPVMNIDLDGLEGMAGNMASPGKWHIPGDANDDGHLTKQELKQGGTIMTATALLPVEVFVTKGWITRTLFASQIAGAFEHNRATTPAGRIEQDQRSKEALSDAAITWGTGELLGVGMNVTSQVAKLATNRFNFAKTFYKEAGFAEEEFVKHASGIDLTGKVFEQTYTKGTVLEQWSYIGKDGNPIRGNYYTLPGTDPNTLGVAIKDRVKTLVTLEENTTFLQSTAGDIHKGGQTLKGGGVQLFQVNVKATVTVPPTTP